MLRLFGQPVDPLDAANLTLALREDGRPDSISAAIAIEHALPNPSDVELTPIQRDAIAHVLSHVNGNLAKLKQILEHKH